ncbi:hypothetical protein LXL04_022547 [Taraxacum kok-saghyz]
MVVYSLLDMNEMTSGLGDLMYNQLDIENELVLGGSVKTAMAPPAVTTTLVTPKSNPPILRNPRTTGVNPDASPQDSNLRPPLGKPRTIAKRPGDHLPL